MHFTPDKCMDYQKFLSDILDYFPNLQSLITSCCAQTVSPRIIVTCLNVDASSKLGQDTSKVESMKHSETHDVNETKDHILIGIFCVAIICLVGFIGYILIFKHRTAVFVPNENIISRNTFELNSFSPGLPNLNSSYL